MITVTVTLPLNVVYHSGRVAQQCEAEKVFEVPDAPFPIDVMLWVGEEPIGMNTSIIVWDTRRAAFVARLPERTLSFENITSNDRLFWEELNDATSGWKVNHSRRSSTSA